MTQKQWEWLPLKRRTLQKMGYTTLLTGICAVTLALPVRAQTRFSVPDTTADVSRYRTVEECIVASTRVERAALLARPVWRDTVEITQREELDSTPNSVVEVARRCSAQFNPDTVSLDRFDDWMRLYLYANRDDAADRVFQRKRAKMNDTAVTPDERFRILRSAISQYSAARPMRWEKVLAIGELFAADQKLWTDQQRLLIYNHQFNLADAVNDTAALRNFANQIVTLSNAMTADAKAQDWYRHMGRYAVTGALDFLAERALMDSLRHSSMAYIALKEANWKQARGDNTDPLPQYIGRKAEPLVADFWFSSGDSQGASLSGPSAGEGERAFQRPVPGKVNLILFLRNGCREETIPFAGDKVRPTFFGSCWDTYAILHRMAKRFPNLEMTVVSLTSGYIGETPPMEPKKEAEVMRSWWLGFHRLPATLAVTNRNFFRLQEPDRRRIDDPTENATNYSFGGLQEIPMEMAYLVDVDGTILLSGYLMRESERTFREILEIVSARK